MNKLELKIIRYLLGLQNNFAITIIVHGHYLATSTNQA